MFLWAFMMIFLCSFNAWVLLFQYPEDIFSRGLVGTYIVILAVMLRAVWRKALQMGVSAGCATAFSGWLGTKELTMELLGQIHVRNAPSLPMETITLRAPSSWS